jgi:hypothetical protein
MMPFERGGQKTILVATLDSFRFRRPRDGGEMKWTPEFFIRDDAPPQVKANTAACYRTSRHELTTIALVTSRRRALV